MIKRWIRENDVIGWLLLFQVLEYISLHQANASNAHSLYVFSDVFAVNAVSLYGSNVLASERSKLITYTACARKEVQDADFLKVITV